MEISVKATKMPEGSDSHTKGLATINFGEQLKVRSVSIIEGKEGELFVAMPSYKTSRKDENGKDIYNPVCNPITADFRKQLFDAILQSYETGESVKFDDGAGIKMTAIAHSYDEPKFGNVGNAKVYINDNFVVSGIGIREGKDDSKFITMPSFKTSRHDENGKPVYQDVVYAANDTVKKNLTEAVLKVYEESKEIKLESPAIDNPFETEKESSRPEVEEKKEEKREEKKESKPKEEKKQSIADKMKDKKKQVDAQIPKPTAPEKGIEK